MATDADVWKQCFTQWPTEMERRGVLVTTFNEQIPFQSFGIGPDLLLIERLAPDTMGARLVLIAYQHIQAVKITDVVKMRIFQSMGIVVPAARK
jgi:hypothetical protein